jgi:hypothetical protein
MVASPRSNFEISSDVNDGRYKLCWENLSGTLTVIWIGRSQTSIGVSWRIRDKTQIYQEPRGKYMYYDLFESRFFRHNIYHPHPEWTPQKVPRREFRWRHSSKIWNGTLNLLWNKIAWIVFVDILSLFGCHSISWQFSLSILLFSINLTVPMTSVYYSQISMSKWASLSLHEKRRQ